MMPGSLHTAGRPSGPGTLNIGRLARLLRDRIRQRCGGGRQQGMTVAAPPLHALFQRWVEGDDALLRLARLRFEQAGLAAEAYADSPDNLDRMLGFVPEGARAPTVHLSRRIDLLRQP